MLRTRLKTALIALPILVAVIALPPSPIFTLVIALLALWGLFEIAEMTGGDSRWLLVLLAGAIPAAEMLLTGHALPAAPMLCLIVFALLMMLMTQVSTGGAGYVSGSSLLTVLGAAWVGIFFPYFALLRNREEGIPVIIFILLLAFASDTGAYFVGRLTGRIKLVPRVSPHKTVEGALGGLGSALILGLILCKTLVPWLSLLSAVILSLGVGILAQAGDLANSAFKRVAGVKDSGWIFPGHGGLLDRASSLVFPAVFTYYCVR